MKAIEARRENPSFHIQVKAAEVAIAEEEPTPTADSEAEVVKIPRM